MIQTNHLAKDLVTKGMLNISILTKGMLLPFAYEIVTKKKRRTGSGGLAGEPYKELKEDIIELRKDKDDEIDYIKVFVKWDKKVNRNKKIYAELIKKKILAELDENQQDIEIKVQLEEIKEPNINVEIIEEK